MYAGQYETMMRLLEEIRDRIPTSAPTSLPVTNFVQAVDSDGDRLFLDEQGTIRFVKSNDAPGNWTPLYVRVPS